jgi:hypothetical protein
VGLLCPSWRVGNAHWNQKLRRELERMVGKVGKPQASAPMLIDELKI